MITVFGVRTKIIYFINIYKFCKNGSMFTGFLIQTKVQKDRQLKMSRGSTIYNNIIRKTRPFQQQQQKKIIYRSWSTHSKVMAEQRFKKILM